MPEYNVGFTPKGGAKVAFQKIFTNLTGQALLNQLHAVQRTCAGLRATRKVQREDDPQVITGPGHELIMKFVHADKTTSTLSWHHFNEQTSPSEFAEALVGVHVNGANSASTAVVEVRVKNQIYV